MPNRANEGDHGSGGTAARVRCCGCGEDGDELLADTLACPAVTLTTFYCPACWSQSRHHLPDGLNPPLLRSALRWIMQCDAGQRWAGGRLPLYTPGDRRPGRPWGVVGMIGQA